MLHEDGAKAALAAAGKQHTLTIDNLTCPLHIEACLLHNPRKNDQPRPLGQQNRLHADEHQRCRRSSGHRSDGASNGSMTSSGDR